MKKSKPLPEHVTVGSIVETPVGVPVLPPIKCEPVTIYWKIIEVSAARESIVPNRGQSVGEGNEVRPVHHRKAESPIEVSPLGRKGNFQFS